MLSLSEDERRILLARMDSLPPSEIVRVVSALRTEALSRCASDGKFWLQFVDTRDEADPDHSVKDFPVHLEYVRSIWDVLVSRQRIIIAKSRQMLASWIACAFCVWWARFKPNQLIIWQTQKEDDAIEKICTSGSKPGAYMGRCQFIEKYLPSWMQMDIRESEGRLDYPNGSRIQAVPGGADKVRGLTASIIVEDEFAHQPESRGVYTAVAPLIQKATKFIAISTPNGRENTFAHLYHGTLVN